MTSAERTARGQRLQGVDPRRPAAPPSDVVADARAALRHARYEHAAVSVVAVGLLVTELFVGETFAERGLRTASVVTSAVLVIGLGLVLSRTRTRLLSLGPVYLLFLGVFHCGILIPLALTGHVDLFNDSDLLWLSSPTVPEATRFVTVALLSFVAAYVVASRPARHEAKTPMRTADGGSTAPVGWALLIVGIGAWYWLSVSAGAFAVGGSYTNYLTMTANQPMPYAYLGIGVGLPLASVGSRTTERWALAAFALWAIPAFLIGLRGEVLLPLAAYLVLRARRNRPRLVRLAVGTVIGLGCGAFIRTVRVEGLASSAIDPSAFNPINGLIELGYSIRPVSEVFRWQLMGEPHVGGGTYLHPVLRIPNVIFHLGVQRAANDPTALMPTIMERSGPIGGSPVAEAYRSGGVVAIVVVMAIIGVFCAVLDRHPSGPRWDPFVGAVAFILLLWVRNDFLPVPFQCLVALLAIWLGSVTWSGDRNRVARRGRRT